MKASVISIGNSKGIRLPKMMLKELEIEGEVDLSIENEKIIIKPLKDKPREGWDKAFALMHKRGDDALLMSEHIDSQMEDWE